nr:hypothetical protein [uncultured Sphingosinicella sp.]
MASTQASKADGACAGQMLLTCVAERGSAAHPYAASEALLKSAHAARNLADAVHLICTLHGRHPGAVDHAANRSVEVAARQWLKEAVEEFTDQRALLARLAVAAGPIPSTPGAGDYQATVLGQRHAIEMLAQSERSGCALGAALALALDWATIHPILAAAAARFGVEAAPYALGDAEVLRGVADEAAATPSVQRALLFGAEQIAVQHHGLWDLLEARQEARDAT